MGEHKVKRAKAEAADRKTKESGGLAGHSQLHR